MGEEAPPSPVMRPAFYDGCPGCAMERKLESSQGIPYKELIFVGITTIASYPLAPNACPNLIDNHGGGGCEDGMMTKAVAATR
ncbi:hypothetical protein E2562_021069 [Oryza meyeriana var. granulata]|uniref:Uncharacterized protein n=1 Tax=Oryza meyeriana var. granulata TaxID=110450 RepID=A0A6G1BMI6_9ORYZ|nr:hypothetical protein E2562_021069 [Oryza meyeriana var. granulata]